MRSFHFLWLSSSVCDTGAQVRIGEVEHLVRVYHGDTLIRVLIIDPDRYR